MAAAPTKSARAADAMSGGDCLKIGFMVSVVLVSAVLLGYWFAREKIVRRLLKPMALALK